MRRDLLNVEQHQTVRRQDPTDREQREVGEVLVVDRVELVLRDEAHEVGELHRDHAPRREQVFHPGDEVVEVGHLGQHVVTDQQVRPAPLSRDLPRGVAPEESDEGRHSLPLSFPRDVRRGLDAQSRDASADEVLQQVTVVARHFHHVAVRPEREPVHHRGDVTSCVL